MLNKLYRQKKCASRATHYVITKKKLLKIPTNEALIHFSNKKRSEIDGTMCID